MEIEDKAEDVHFLVLFYHPSKVSKSFWMPEYMVNVSCLLLAAPSKLALTMSSYRLNLSEFHYSQKNGCICKNKNKKLIKHGISVVTVFLFCCPSPLRIRPFKAHHRSVVTSGIKISCTHSASLWWPQKVKRRPLNVVPSRATTTTTHPRRFFFYIYFYPFLYLLPLCSALTWPASPPRCCSGCSPGAAPLPTDTSQRSDGARSLSSKLRGFSSLSSAETPLTRCPIFSAPLSDSTTPRIAWLYGECLHCNVPCICSNKQP